MNRVFDFALAASVLAWGAHGWLGAEAPLHPVTLGVGLLQLSVVIALLARTPERRSAPLAALALASPAVLIGAVVLSATPGLGDWPGSAVVAFGVGSAIACVSLLRLGRSFAVLPSLRTIVTRGPYRVIRHPAYLGEGTMVAAACVAIGGATGSLLALVTAATLALRILAEERVLAHDPAYLAYAGRVRWRVLPGVW